MARRTHCPQGRPIYRVGEVPERLATVTGLAEQRRRLAEGQEPIASLLYSLGNRYAPLYVVADAVELPPLTPARQARHDAIRSCVRCTARRPSPWPKDWFSGRRVCPHCAEVEAQSTWLAERNLARAAAVAWAAAVVADRSAVLIHDADGPGTTGTYTVSAVHVADESPLIDVWILPDWRALTDFPDDGDDGPDLLGDVVDEVRKLDDRRLIAWHATAVPRLRRGLTAIGEALPPEVRRGAYSWTPDGTGTPGDALSVWYAEWLGMRARDGSWRYDRSVSHPPLPYPPDAPATAAAEYMLQMLHLMAVDDHPAGPVTCPSLLPGTRDICGAPGPLLEGRWCQSCALAHVDAVIAGDEPAA